MTLDLDDPLAQAMAEAVAGAAASWPGIQVSPSAFAAHVQRHGMDPGTVARRGAELYLALACAAGDPVALQVFNASLMTAARRQMARVGVTGDFADELLQALRVRLLVGESARIGGYRGEGSLESWIRVAAAHAALNALEANQVRQRRTLAAEAEKYVGNANDPEVAVAKERLRQPLSAALEAALVTLTPREKTLLRLHILDNLTIDEIGSMYRVHRATAARWLVGIRAALLAAVREHLGLPARPSSSEFRSIVALLRDELHVTVERALAG
jgi:RNA polymerase sigma-70 factor (ECF subfamily)